MLKNILVQFTELYNMTCVFYKVEGKLIECLKTTTPSCIPKKESKILHLS